MRMMRNWKGRSFLVAAIFVALVATSFSIAPGARSSTAQCQNGCNAQFSDCRPGCRDDSGDCRDVCNASFVPGTPEYNDCQTACTAVQVACDVSCKSLRLECKQNCPRGQKESPSEPQL